jgi:predicted RNA-binding protein with RPS1 domain
MGYNGRQTSCTLTVVKELLAIVIAIGAVLNTTPTTAFSQVLPRLTVTCTQRTRNSAIFGRLYTESKRNGEITALLPSPVAKNSSKKNRNQRGGDKKRKTQDKQKDLKTNELSRFLTLSDEPILNSVHNATIKQITKSTMEDGTTTVGLVYVNLDCAPNVPVKLTGGNATSSFPPRWNVGKRVKVRITDVDTTTDEILSCALVEGSSSSRGRQSKSDNGQRSAASFQRKSLEEMVPYLGKMVSGRVVSTTQYGAFLDIGCKNRNAILHKSRITRTTRVDNVTDFVDVGQTLIVRLIEVDPEKGNMAVSMLNEKSEQYMKWRKQHYEVRRYRQAARVAAARAAAAIFEENEVAEDVATALLYRMNKEEEDKSKKDEEILHGQWVAS